MVSISVIEQTHQKIFCPLKDIVEQCCHLAPPDTTATTVFLCGNSTVVDQQKEPYASWRQMGKTPKMCTSRQVLLFYVVSVRKIGGKSAPFTKKCAESRT